MARGEPDDNAEWIAEVLEEIRLILGELVVQGGGTQPDQRPPWGR